MTKPTIIVLATIIEEPKTPLTVHMKIIEEPKTPLTVHMKIIDEETPVAFGDSKLIAVEEPPAPTRPPGRLEVCTDEEWTALGLDKPQRL